MLTFKNPKTIATVLCVGALLSPLAPLVGSFAGPSHVAYASVLPLNTDAENAAATAKVGTQSLSVNAAAAPAPAPTFDSFWATPQKTLDHRAAVARQKQANDWEVKARKAIIKDAQQYVGVVPYVFGGATPSGWDCSGYTQYVLNETLGINVAHSVLAQRAVGHIVKKADAQPGDLVVFSSASEDGFHVGIYLGGDQMLNAPVPGQMTKVGNVYWDPSNTVQFVNVLGLAPDAPAQLDHWKAGANS